MEILTKFAEWPTPLRVLVTLILCGLFIVSICVLWPEAVSKVFTMSAYRTPLPVPRSGLFSIALTHLKNDPRGEMRSLIMEGLQEFSGVEVLLYDRIIYNENPNSATAGAKNNEAAKILIGEGGADILLWGTVITKDGKSVPKLYWTPSNGGKVKPFERYVPEPDTLRLPELFWVDLRNILRLLIFEAGSAFDSMSEADVQECRRFIERVRGILSSGAAWAEADRRQVQNLLANALVFLSEKLGHQAYTEDAISTYRDLIRSADTVAPSFEEARVRNNFANALLLLSRLRSHNPYAREGIEEYEKAAASFKALGRHRNWAEVQVNLGIALVQVGQSVSRVQEVEEGLSRYRAALQVFTRERFPGDWAKVHINIAAALVRLGELRPGVSDLESSIAASKEALEYFTRDRNSVAWATCHGNLGVAYRDLGSRLFSAQDVEQAVKHHRSELEVLSLQRGSWRWAMSRMNLGIALGFLGDLYANPDFNLEAIAEYREALLSVDRIHNPKLWASLQSNLGVALVRLAEIRKEYKYIEEASVALSAALEERTPQRSLREWIITFASLGRLHEASGALTGFSQELEESLKVYTEIAGHLDEEEAPTLWSSVNGDIARVYMVMSQKRNRMDVLELAILHYRRALKYDASPYSKGSNLNDLAACLAKLGDVRSEMSLLEEAIATWAAAEKEFQKLNRSSEIDLVQRNTAAVQGLLNRARASK